MNTLTLGNGYVVRLPLSLGTVDGIREYERTHTIPLGNDGGWEYLGDPTTGHVYCRPMAGRSPGCEPSAYGSASYWRSGIGRWLHAENLTYAGRTWHNSAWSAR